MIENKLDVCAVSEVDVINTKFHYDNLYEIKGYSFVFPTSWKKGKARMIVYYKKHLEPFIKIRRDLMSKNQPDVWLELKSKNDRNLVVGFYYREFTGMDGDRSIEQQRVRLKEWTSAASKVEDEKKELVTMGDFNVDLLKEHDTEDPDSISNILKACCLENGWEQKITLPTRSRVVEMAAKKEGKQPRGSHQGPVQTRSRQPDCEIGDARPATRKTDSRVGHRYEQSPSSISSCKWRKQNI